MEKLSELKALKKDPKVLREAAEAKLRAEAKRKGVLVEQKVMTVDAERLLKWCSRARAAHVVRMINRRNDQHEVAFEQGYALALTELLAFAKGVTKGEAEKLVAKDLEALPSLSEIEAEGEYNGY